jgi:hypothetical protein
VTADIVQTTAPPTGGGLSGATLDANITVRSVVSSHTAILVLLPPAARSNLARQRKSSRSAAYAVYRRKKRYS